MRMKCDNSLPGKEKEEKGNEEEERWYKYFLNFLNGLWRRQIQSKIPEVQKKKTKNAKLKKKPRHTHLQLRESRNLRNKFKIKVKMKNPTLAKRNEK